jgi:hypothetical protein
MLYLKPQQLESPDDLRAALANAITLELSTIPPYLTALFSIKPGVNAAAGAIVRSVVIEEMLHLSLACNLLNAVGGSPDLPGSVRTYPTPLPMDIGSEPGKTFCVPLSRLSMDTVQNVFMVIEEPDRPIDFPEQGLAAIETDYHTIGDFYRAVLALIESLSPGIFTEDHSRQVTGWVGRDRLHAVVDLDTASQAINLIIDQGEGTTRRAGALLPLRADPAR